MPSLLVCFTPQFFALWCEAKPPYGKPLAESLCFNSTSDYVLRTQKHRPACFAAHLGVGSLDYSLGRIAVFEIAFRYRSSATLGTSPPRRARAFLNQPNSSLRNSFNCPCRVACAIAKSSCPPSGEVGFAPKN